MERLSSPEAGRNHVMVPRAFESLWRRLLAAQGEDFREADDTPEEPSIGPSSLPNGMLGVSDVTADRLRARFEKKGLNCEVEGSPRAVADFLRMVSSWDAGQA